MDKWDGSFAKTQLEKFGWSSGDGLGKHRDGRTKHVTVSKKNDKKGVGVGSSQWEFAWWDHLYNKSASEVTVAKDEQDKVVVAAKSKTDMQRSTTGIISTERPTGKPMMAKEASSMSAVADQINDSMDTMVKDLHVSMAQRIANGALYGGFVKSSTGAFDPSTPTTESSTPASEEDDTEALKDYSIKVTDAELFAACEGRTARKGGRGLVEQKGKFARVMQEYLQHDDDLNKKRKHSHDDDNDDDKKKKKKAKKDKKEKKAKKEKKTKKEKKAKKDKKDKSTA
ncbi:hypothetical protein BC941DRAFT_430337 [Chlamydoabsidia padenii]|nr:hypothetical protein BC941DRAFT_430337 [Chlamydoabsidia padenii]